ncbi:hypothetical protein [Roseibium sp. Sym1]|uniref:hypothetical protein n=1 Tax=Roseibium sp. Sym1 TaxID=3016006 RepID=UPI0022B31CCA|nr:hypothetical protein [Roseibium sp. Sym1]
MTSWKILLVELDTIKELFGEEVSELVYWLTDVSKPGDGNREARKTIDREHIAKAPADAKTIKLADLIDNTKSITSHDPDFSVVYMKEISKLLQVLNDDNQVLYSVAANQVSNYYSGILEK